MSCKQVNMKPPTLIMRAMLLLLMLYKIGKMDCSLISSERDVMFYTLPGWFISERYKACILMILLTFWCKCVRWWAFALFSASEAFFFLFIHFK